MATTTSRSTAAARRDEVLDAAMIEFAERGFEGASTEDIARRAGISQPYLFRLFGTKKELFKASVSRCLREMLELFQRAAEGKRGEAALEAIGQAYVDQLEADRVRLRAQMNAYVLKSGGSKVASYTGMTARVGCFSVFPVASNLMTPAALIAVMERWLGADISHASRSARAYVEREHSWSQAREILREKLVAF